MDREAFVRRLARWRQWAPPSVFVIVLLPLVLVGAGIVPVVRFTREQIDITIRPHSVEVSGVYVYENPLPIAWRQGLKTPFPDNPGQTPPAAVELAESFAPASAALLPLHAVWLRGEPYFEAAVPARGAAFVRVRFRQYVAGHRGVYLLTTTRPWRRALEYGKYVLHCEGVRITGSNYPLSGDPPSFERANFFPDADWTFTWEETHAQ